MEEPIVEVNQRVKDMKINDYDEDDEIKFDDNGRPIMRVPNLPSFCMEDIFRRCGIDPDKVIENAKKTNPFLPDDAKPPQSGICLVPCGRPGCFRGIGPDLFKEVVLPCADQALADFNRKHNTDYKIDEGFNDACFREEFKVGCYRIHCNFTAKPETKPLKDGILWQEDFFADAERKTDGSISVISYSVLDGKIKYGCEMCPSLMRHPAS